MIRLSRIDPLSKQFQNEFIEAMCWNIYPNASLECIVLWQNNLSCLHHEIRAQNNEIQFNYLAYNIHEFKFSEHIRTEFKLRKCCMRLAFWYWIDFQMFDKNSQLDGRTVDMGTDGSAFCSITKFGRLCNGNSFRDITNVIDWMMRMQSVKIQILIHLVNYNPYRNSATVPAQCL